MGISDGNFPWESQFSHFPNFPPYVVGGKVGKKGIGKRREKKEVGKNQVAACDGVKNPISPWLPASVCDDCLRRLVGLRSEMSAQWIEPAIKVVDKRSVCENRVVEK